MSIDIQTDRVVSLAYQLSEVGGRLLEEKTPDDPYEYMHGHGQINEAVERALVGKTPGFQCEIQLSPREGYGEYNDTLIVEIPRSRFPSDVAVGMKFGTTGPDGKPMTVRVIESDDETVTVDGNHPLAGLELIFSLTVLDVRVATDSEIEVGRPSVETERKGSSLH